MKKEEYRKLYRRELEKLKIEFELYRNENNIWKIDNEIANSAGNLGLHIVGNLNHFIGFALHKTDYTRNRENEFLLKNIPVKKLVSEIDLTIETIDNYLQSIDEDELKSEYPIIKFEEKASIEYLLSHLLIHLSYHLGQINYHRRIFDKDERSSNY